MRRALLGLASLFTVSAGAAATAHAEDITISTTLGFESRYMFRGIQFAQASFQPTISAGYGGFYATAWLNLPVGDEDGLFLGGEELDLVAGYSTDLTEFVSVDVGVTYYTFPSLDDGIFDTYSEDGDGLGSNTVEPYIGLSFALPLSPSVYLYRDFMYDTFTVQGSLSYSYPLAEKISLDASGIVGYVIDDDPGSDYLYGHLSLNISYAFSDHSSIYVGGRFGGSDIAGGSVIDDASLGITKSNGFWSGLGFTAEF